MALQDRNGTKLADETVSAKHGEQGALHAGRGTKVADNTVSEIQGKQDGDNSKPSMHQNDDDANHSEPSTHDSETGESNLRNEHVVENKNQAETRGSNHKNKHVVETRNQADSNNNRELKSKERNLQAHSGVKDDNKPLQSLDTSEGDTNEEDINNNSGQGDGGESGYKSHFKLSMESELFQQQVMRSPRSQRNDLNLSLSGNTFKQHFENVKMGRNIEIPQTNQQYTKGVSNHNRSGSVNSNVPQAILRQRQAELSTSVVDHMQKYRPGENPPGTLYPRAPSQNNNSSMISVQYSPRQNSSRMSKVMLTPREYDITENLYPERIISPQSTQRYIQVSRLPLQTRVGGDMEPGSNNGYSSPPGSPGCEGPLNYRIVKAEKRESYVQGQSFGEPYVSPARKRLEVR